MSSLPPPILDPPKSVNPYASPAARPGAAHSGIADRIRREIRGTAPWAVVATLIGVYTIISGLVQSLPVLWMLRLPDGPFATQAEARAALFSSVAVLIATVVFYSLTFKLGSFARGLSAAAKSGDIRDLEQAVKQQKNYWITLARFMIAMLILAVLGIAVVVLTILGKN